MSFLSLFARPLAVLGGFVLIVALPAQNPIVQTAYTADPAPLVHKGTLYLYTGHDEDKSNVFVMQDWRCYATKDMVNWTDLGSPLSVKDFAWAKADAWAGQCIERNGKFYYYVPMTRREGGMAIGVAVADRPEGPFRDAIGKPLVFDQFGDIDPCVFIDRDGQAYLGWGNPTYKYVRLNRDMVSFDTSVGDQGIFRGPMTVEAFGKRRTPDRATAYEEGPWLYRRKDLCYLVYAGGPVPEHLAYATAPNPTGPWKYGGEIMSTQGGSFTNHPGVVDYKGRTYLFYHNGALPGGGGFTRSVCVDEMRFGPDGAILPMDMTKEGPGPVARLNPYVRNEAETIAWESGVETEPCRAGGMQVSDIDDGDSIRVRNVDFGRGAKGFSAMVASGMGGTLELHLDAPDGLLVGQVPIGKADGPEQWRTESAKISAAKGVHDLYLVFRGAPATKLFAIDWWKFTK
jgi:arabinoxylan arabinofuranohydrolase